MPAGLRFARWEWLLLLVVAPFLWLPPGPYSLLLLVIPVLWLWRIRLLGRQSMSTPLDLPILGLLIMAAVSVLVTPDRAQSFPKLAGLILGIAFYYAAVNLQRQERRGVWLLLAGLLATALAIALAALLVVEWSGPFAGLNQLRTLLPFEASVPGTVTGLVNANELAGVLVWIAPLALAGTLGLGRRLWPERKGYVILLVATLLVLALVLPATLSRSGMLAMLAATAIMLAIRYRWGVVLLLLLLVAALLAALYFDLAELLVGRTVTASEFGLEARLEIWASGLNAVADFPLTGMGMNTFRSLVHELYPMPLIRPDVDLGHAHNQLLQAGLDLGIPGLISYLALWLLAGVLLWRAWRAAGTVAGRTIVLGLIGALAASWTFGLLDAIALGARPGFIWWVLMALIVGVHEQAPADDTLTTSGA